MDFHIITSKGGMHLFSIHNGRLVEAPSNTVDSHRAEPVATSRTAVITEVSEVSGETSAIPTVVALSLEINRLRSIIRSADQLQRMLTTLPGLQDDILNKLREKLKEAQLMSKP